MRKRLRKKLRLGEFTPTVLLLEAERRLETDEDEVRVWDEFVETLESRGLSTRGGFGNGNVSVCVSTSARYGHVTEQDRVALIARLAQLGATNVEATLKADV